MDFASWFGFVCVALLVTFSPGPAVLLAISNSLAVGAGRAMIGSLGNALGVLAVATAATVGLGVLLKASATAFMLLKILGAIYLVWLGIKQWRSGNTAFAAGTPTAPQVSARRLFGNGLTVALTNPKSILFFTAFFPQFLDPTAPDSRQFIVLALSFAGCALFSHAFYVLLAHGLKSRLSSPRRALALNRLFGASFVALGVSLLGLRNKTA